MQARIATLAAILAVCAACAPVPSPGTPHDAPAPSQRFVYGNPEDTTDPLNPSNKGRNPRVVDGEGKVKCYPLRAGGAPLTYGDGQPMRTPQGALVRATGAVRLNYGVRLVRDGRTYFMAWQTNPDDPPDSGKKNATGWVAADDMTEGSAAAANADIPHRLGSVERPVARDSGGRPRTFVVNGTNAPAKAAAARELAYIGVANHHRDRVVNFLNLHDGRAGLQMLVNLPDVPGGGIAQDCFPNGTTFTAGAGEGGGLITRPVRVYDKEDREQALTFIYGKAGQTWGWMVKDWLD